MTRDEAKKLLPVIQAFADGKDVQYQFQGEWEDAGSNTMFNAGWVWRIKPEPLECWVVKDRDGDKFPFMDSDEAKEFADETDFRPCTIHHMREVIE